MKLKEYVILLAMLLVPAMVIHAQTTPTNADAKRSWNIAQMYIEEDSPELAINELKNVVYHENYAPAYLKLVELCYKLGDVKHVEMAEKYSKDFMSLWPARAEEMKDLIALGEARGKLRRKNFYESLIGDWHHENFKMGEWYCEFKVRKNENGNIYVIIPKEMYDYDWITEWQDGKFMQWEGDNGVYLCETRYNTVDGYMVKVPTSEGYPHFVYVSLYIPFDQPTLSEGKIKVSISTKTSFGNNQYYKTQRLEHIFVKN